MPSKETVALMLFTGKSCAPCAIAKAVLDHCCRYYQIDVELAPVTATKYGIRSIPTLIAVFGDGKRIEQYNGRFTVTGVRYWLEKIGVRRTEKE